ALRVPPGRDRGLRDAGGDHAIHDQVDGPGRLVAGDPRAPGGRGRRWGFGTSRGAGGPEGLRAAGRDLAGDRPAAAGRGGGGEGVRRVTLTIPNEFRFLLLLESQPNASTFARLGEVGYTREGVSFAAGESGPVCIVTEGRGTIQVSHKGKTYYVCCSGCKDLF